MELNNLMDKLLEFLSEMKTESALAEIAQVLKRLLADLDSDARERYLMNLIEQSKGDKVTSMVHY